MPNDLDIKWATQFSSSLQRKETLPPLKQLVSFTDKTGVLSAILTGDSKQPKKLYSGTTALDLLASSLGSNNSVEPEKRHSQDRTDRHYSDLTKLSQEGDLKTIPQLLRHWKHGEKSLFRIYERFFKYDDFPFPILKKSDLILILGENGEKLSISGILYSASKYYFECFSLMPGSTRKWLALEIKNTLDTLHTTDKLRASLRSWAKASTLLFAEKADEELAKNYLESPDANSSLFANKLNLNEDTSLFSAVRLQALCLRLERIPLTGESEAFTAIINEKNEKINDTYCVAAKAMEITLNRTIKENNGILSKPWANFFVSIGCHPDPVLSAEAVYYKLWKIWKPKKKHLDAARTAYVQRDLEVIFDFLRHSATQGQKDGHMVKPRIDFFKALLRNNLIKDTRLFLGINAHNKLRLSKGNEQFWDLHSADDADLCILALKLHDGANGFNLTTGTKSFPMRFFPENSKQFEKIWNAFSAKRIHPKFTRQYFMTAEYDSILSRKICIRKAHQGDWKSCVLDEILPSSFLGRIDWSHYDL